VQGAAGFEYAPYLAQRLLFIVRPEVVKHEGGEYPVERSVRVRKLLREPEIQSNGERFAPGLSPGPGERLRVGIQPDYLRIRMEAFGEER
jgi:hypothetical protein